MILPKVRDPRFVTIRRGGTLTDSDHHLLALWAASCAEHVLHLFESAQPDDPRPREAIEHARAWVRGEVTMMQARAAGGHAMGAARNLRGAARHAAYAAGQAGAVAHAVPAAVRTYFRQHHARYRGKLHAAVRHADPHRMMRYDRGHKNCTADRTTSWRPAWHPARHRTSACFGPALDTLGRCQYVPEADRGPWSLIWTWPTSCAFIYRSTQACAPNPFVRPELARMSIKVSGCGPTGGNEQVAVVQGGG
jgi:hypothetical protein